MYSRPPSSVGSRGMRIPGNYSGNAFSTPVPNPPDDPSEREPDPPKETVSPLPAAEEERRDPPHLPASRLFPAKGSSSLVGRLLGSFGTEELLILGLILLLAGNDSSDDLLLLLVLLLFIQ